MMMADAPKFTSRQVTPKRPSQPTRTMTAPRITQDEILERIRIEKLHDDRHDGVECFTASEYAEIFAERKELGQLQLLRNLETLGKACLLPAAWARFKTLELKRERDSWMERD